MVWKLIWAYTTTVPVRRWPLLVQLTVKPYLQMLVKDYILGYMWHSRTVVLRGSTQMAWNMFSEDLKTLCGGPLHSWGLYTPPRPPVGKILDPIFLQIMLFSVDFSFSIVWFGWLPECCDKSPRSFLCLLYFNSGRLHFFLALVQTKCINYITERSLESTFTAAKTVLSVYHWVVPRSLLNTVYVLNM